MAKISLLPADTYTVFNKTILHDYDRQVLTMLYQPVVGLDAIGLYFTLWSYLDRNGLMSGEWTHHHLMASLRMDLDSIIEAREKIEAIGLLKTMVKKGKVNEYIYNLYSPLSADEFFKDPVLGQILKQNVGDTEFSRLLEFYSVPDFKAKGFDEITTTFSEVYKVTLDSNYEVLEAELKRRNKNKLKIRTKIRFNELISLIPEELLNPASITSTQRDLIYKLSLIYDLNTNQMRDVIKVSLNEKKMIDKEKLQKNASNYFKFENKGKLPSIAYKKQPSYLNTKISSISNLNKMIYTFETTSPRDFLANKNKNGKITNSDKQILSYLLIELKLNPGVVNVLLDYILRINNSNLNKKFVEAVASQWLKLNIETVSDALELAKKEYEKRRKITTRKKQSKTKHSEMVPDWFNKDIKENKSKDKDLNINDLLKEYK